MENFVSNIKSVFGAPNANESGDLAPNVIWNALMIVAAIAAVGWITSAVLGKAADASECLTDTNVLANTGADCAEGTHSDESNFKDSDSYKSRFGN